MTTTGSKLGEALKIAQAQQQVVPFVGVYDLFSASLAADRFGALFLSGFGLAASTFGLPDVGFIGWGDLTTTTSRLRALLPDHHLLVDIDDGFGDAMVASHVARTLERCGASGVVLEDQARPRRCGHLDGKKLLPLQ
jgi:2-methylisocitrate lyase-like PEP mutase family enzyme